MNGEEAADLKKWGQVFRLLIEKAEFDDFHFEVDESGDFYICHDGGRVLIW